MKIKTKTMPYDKVMELPRPGYKKPIRPNFILSTVIRAVGELDSWKTRFSFTKEGMERIGKEPCLILMNHSSFLDLKLASKMLYPRPYCIVSTDDSFVGKRLLMRMVGCIPTQKFVSDNQLISDIKYAIKTLGVSVLMFPEAGYSFDGRSTALPERMGVLLKYLDAPVVNITTQGAFSYDPLYNKLQLRRVKVSAAMRCLFTREEIKAKSVAELDAAIRDAFSFDGFKWQRENNVKISEPFRADGLERVLYKCPHCSAEGRMEGKDTHITCHACGKSYYMDEYGCLSAVEGETEYKYITDWYDWQRDEVKKEITEGRYRLDTPVDIGVMVDYKAVYMVGEGRLVHDSEGFTLTGCDGRLSYHRPANASYSVNADFFWYEIGDIIGIGNRDQFFYCFPKEGCSVTKIRIAAEEIYKISGRHRRR